MSEGKESVTSRLRSILTCPLCQNIYSEPRLLRCGHTICKECQENMLRFGPVDNMFSCPECRASFGPELNVSNCYALSNITEDVKKSFQGNQATELMCDLCPDSVKAGQRQAVRQCLKCTVLLCEGHVRIHQERMVFQEHKLVKPQENLDQIICLEHKELVLKYLCPETETYTCRVCDSKKKQDEKVREHMAKTDLMETRLESCMETHFESLQVKLKDSMRIVQELWEDFQKEKARKKPSKYSKLRNILLFLIFSLCLVTMLYVQLSSTEKVSLSHKLEDQLTQRYDLYMKMADKSQRYEEMHLIKPEDVSSLATLDMNSTSPFLRVSPDLLSVERTQHKLSLPDHPSRFDKAPQVLTTPCFSQGSHYWKVEAEGYWDIAVSYENIKRKGDGTFFGNNEESWSLTRTDKGDLFVYHNKTKTKVSTSRMAKHVAVAVDFPKSTITFSVVENKAFPLYEFTAQLTQPVCLGFGLYRTDPPSRASVLITR